MSKQLNTRNTTLLFVRLRNLMKFLGPAFIVSVAYIDPPISELEQLFHLKLKSIVNCMSSNTSILLISMTRVPLSITLRFTT